MRTATARRLNYSSSGEILTQNISFVTDGGVREEFSGLVTPYTKHQLADLTGLSPQATALWHRNLRTPTAASIFNLAQTIDSVRDWVAQRCGMERAVQAGSWDVWIQGLYHVAAHDERARKAIRLLQAAGLMDDPVETPLGNLKGVSTEEVARDSMKLIDGQIAREQNNDRATIERCNKIAREIEAEYYREGERAIIEERTG